jgi:hypothetical protein
MDPYYPTRPEEWRDWIHLKIGLSEEDAKDLLERGLFPYDKMVACWQREFSSKKGYSPAFIPALTRNKRGLVEWVYRGGNEPLWTGMDDE